MDCSELKKKLAYPHKRTAFEYFLRNPSLLFVFSKNPSTFYFSKTLENILESNMASYVHHLLPDRFTKHLMENGFEANSGIEFILYSIIRKYKPEIVVETGVAHGGSSAFILCAMHENFKGHLYSIDLPPYDACVKIDVDGRKVLEDGQKWYISSQGAFVPEYLKERWTLINGDAKKELPILLEKIGKMDIFFHDSLHTYEHMLFEYETAWSHIKNHGFLLSHDVIWNKAFLEFSKKVNSKPLLYYSFGVIKKNIQKT